jgi:hypothetical protein
MASKLDKLRRWAWKKLTGGGTGTADETLENVKKRFGTPEKEEQEKPERPADPNMPDYSVEEINRLSAFALKTYKKNKDKNKPK